MFDIFEQPYTLIGAAVLVLFGMFTFRSVFPEKRRRWQLLVPVFLAGVAFGLDVLVPTDLEKINGVIDRGIRAVKDEDCGAIGRVLCDNYNDSYHDTKGQLLVHCRKVLTPPLVEKHEKTGLSPPKIDGPRATTTLFTILTFDKSSYISQNYKSFLFTKSRLTLQKQPDGKWLISRIEVLELDRQPANWGHIR
ncbi:MAG: hypothetical protein JSW66_15525 [Phycisphaerales bacterium]|nr:MAG: hypothetical protein JSW66_15525 [Phycisphaerales bacterium]